MKSTLAHWSVSLIFWTHCIPKLSARSESTQATNWQRIIEFSLLWLKLMDAFVRRLNVAKKNSQRKIIRKNYSPDRPVRLHKRFELSASFPSKRLSRKWKSFQVSLTQLARVCACIFSGFKRVLKFAAFEGNCRNRRKKQDIFQCSLTFLTLTV